MSNNKIPFGLKDGVMVDISEVKSGLACGCVCPSCHRQLQAKKGKKAVHYFSHDPSKESVPCESALETSIHLMAKQILNEEKLAKFPRLEVKESRKDENGQTHEETGIVTEELLINFDQVELEKQLNDIRPDFIGYQNSIPYLIEIAVRHFSDAEKIKKIREKNIHAIEVDLSKIDYTISKDELKVLIIDNIDNKKWLSNPIAKALKAQINASLEEKLKQINELIFEARLKTKANNAVQLATSYAQYSIPQYSKPTHTIKATRARDYDPRWFWCEACHHLFDVPLKNAPYYIETIECPECKHDVSAY